MLSEQIKSFVSGILPDPDIDIVSWANLYRYLPKKSSSEPGKYRTDRTPYLEEIMQRLSPDDPGQEVCFMKATQVGATELVNNWILYTMDISPCPFLMVLPTQEMAQAHSKQKLAPSIEETPRLKGKIKKPKTRDSGNTILVKEFPGGILFLSGSNSGSAFRMKSIQNVALDDIDGFETDVGGEGDPIILARKRTDAFGAKKKIFCISTPTVSETSRIWQLYQESSRGKYFLPCPFCGEFQDLEFGGEECNFGLKFIRDDKKRIKKTWYECKKCHKEISESEKNSMLLKGKWEHEDPSHYRKGYHISSLYSPLGWVSWKQIVEEFLEAKTSKEMLKAWRNTRLGLPFDETGEQPDWLQLKKRAEPYEILTMPEQAQLITAGVDVQDNRLAIIIVAWGHGEEAWVLFFSEIYGDPGRNDVWAQVDGLLNRSYGGHNIITMAVDSGGHFTQEVYNYTRQRFPRVIAVKGMSVSNRPIIGKPSNVDISWQGQTIKNGCQIWPVGSDTAKATIYSRLKLEEKGPGYIHFPIALDDSFYMQLTAEKITTKIIKGYPRLEWVKTYQYNEALDCFVYAYAAALRGGISYLSEKKDIEVKKYTTQQPNQQKWVEKTKTIRARGWMSF